jgi:hypothetical protein
MNKVILIVIVSFIIFGCAKKLKDQFNDQATITDVIMYGDSLCVSTRSTPHIMGIKKDCVYGRSLIELETIDYDHRTIFMALGINDIIQGVSSDQYKEKLEAIVSDNMICILPNIHPTIPSVDHRQVAIEVCSMYIDPVSDCGVSIGNSDGVHYYSEDYQALARCLSVMI